MRSAAGGGPATYRGDGACAAHGDSRPVRQATRPPVEPAGPAGPDRAGRCSHRRGRGEAPYAPALNGKLKWAGRAIPKGEIIFLARMARRHAATAQLSPPAASTLSSADWFTSAATLLSRARTSSRVRAAPGSDGAETGVKLRRHLHVITLSNALSTVSRQDYIAAAPAGARAEGLELASTCFQRIHSAAITYPALTGLLRFRNGLIC